MAANKPARLWRLGEGGRLAPMRTVRVAALGVAATMLVMAGTASAVTVTHGAFHTIDGGVACVYRARGDAPYVVCRNRMRSVRASFAEWFGGGPAPPPAPPPSPPLGVGVVRTVADGHLTLSSNVRMWCAVGYWRPRVGARVLRAVRCFDRTKGFAIAAHAFRRY